MAFAGRQRKQRKGRPCRLHKQIRRPKVLSASMAQAIPQLSPPPPKGDDHGVDIGEVFQDLEADGGVSGDHLGVADRVDKEPVEPRKTTVHERVPPLGKGHLNWFSAQPADPHRVFWSEGRDPALLRCRECPVDEPPRPLLGPYFRRWRSGHDPPDPRVPGGCRLPVV